MDDVSPLLPEGLHRDGQLAQAAFGIATDVADDAWAGVGRSTIS